MKTLFYILVGLVLFFPHTESDAQEERNQSNESNQGLQGSNVEYEKLVQADIEKLEAELKKGRLSKLEQEHYEKTIRHLKAGETYIRSYKPEDSWNLVDIQVAPVSGKSSKTFNSKQHINGKPSRTSVTSYSSSRQMLQYKYVNTTRRKGEPDLKTTSSYKITFDPPPTRIKPGEFYNMVARINTKGTSSNPKKSNASTGFHRVNFFYSLGKNVNLERRVDPLKHVNEVGKTFHKQRYGIRKMISETPNLVDKKTNTYRYVNEVNRVVEKKIRFTISKFNPPRFLRIGAYLTSDKKRQRIVYVYEFNGRLPAKMTLEALDANPKFNSEILPNDLKPTQLINAKTARVGTTADGVSQLLLRAELPSNRSAKFSLNSKEDGTISPLLGGKTVTLAGRYYAFALYTPPVAFSVNKEAPKALFDPKMAPKKRLKNILEYRDIKIQVIEKGSNKKESLTLKLARPPVVLVHGLASDAHECWVVTKPNGTSMISLLEKSGLLPFTVNYQQSNGHPENSAGSSFRGNTTVVWDRADPFVPKPSDDGDNPQKFPTPMSIIKTLSDQAAQETLYPKTDLKKIYSLYQKAKPNRIGGIKHALEYYRSELNLAATQADVIGHSMGGILARCYASKAYNPNYKRAENYNLGDINRLITLNTPHYGSELPHLYDALTKAYVKKETWASLVTRIGAATYASVYLMRPTPAVRDLTAPLNEAKRKESALTKIGSTEIPSFAIATIVDTNQLGLSEFDHGLKYRRLYGAASMTFFYNRPLLEDFLRLRFAQWNEAPQDMRRGAINPTGTVITPEKPTTVDEYLRIINTSIDNNAIYWAHYRDAKYRENLIKHLQESLIVPFGTIDNDRTEKISRSSYDSLKKLAKDEALKIAIGGDIEKLKEPHSDQDVPASTIGLIRSLIYHNDPNNDGAVRVVSQLGGLPKKSTKIIGDKELENGIIHSYSPWHYRVQREVITLLKWQNDRFDPSGFGAAGELTPRYLPSSSLIKSRTDGEKAIRWAGIVPSHAKAYAAVADREKAVILVRPVNRDSTALIAAGNATKAMAVKGKSSNWGPQKGFIPVEQRFSKLWTVHKENPKFRYEQIIKYDGVTQLVLKLDHPKNGRKYVKPAKLFTKDNKQVFCLPASMEPDAEKAILIEKDGGYIVFMTQQAITLTEEQKTALKPLFVLAVDQKSDKTLYVTADYDLLAIGVYNEAIVNYPKDYKDEPTEAVAAADFDSLFGAVTEAQIDIIKALNDEVKKTGYKGGKVTHHGPEVQYPDSPYIDYPILVCDPGEPDVENDQSTFIIHQGPPGFRDIHLKRYFASRIKKGYHLWSNPDSKGWLWQEHRKFTISLGYDPTDALRLLPYVKEQTDPDAETKEKKLLVKPTPTPPTPPKPTPSNKPADQQIDKDKMLLKQLQTLANHGDSKSQIKLAKMYLNGIGTKASEDQFRIYAKAAMDGGDIDGELLYAEALLLGLGGRPDAKGAMDILIDVWKKDEHHPHALFLAAAIYVDGRGVPKDEKKGMKYLKESAKLNYPPANFYYGLKFMETHPKEAMAYVKRSAALGFHGAHYYLATDAEDGKIGKKNPALAIKHYLKAAEVQDFRTGFNRVGNFYLNGVDGVAKNEKLAIDYFLLGSRASDASARFNLAWCYRHGRGVPKDLVISQAWYQFSIQCGVPADDEMILINAKKLTSQQNKAAKKLCEQWKAKHP